MRAKQKSGIVLLIAGLMTWVVFNVAKKQGKKVPEFIKENLK